MTGSRSLSIDSVKGFCLLHMLLLHLVIIYGAINFEGEGAGLYFHLMEFFMIPFYLFSGYFFSSRKTIREFVKHKARKLLIPLAFWSIVSLPVFYLSRYLVNGSVQWAEPFHMFVSIGSLYSNSPLWFLFSLFFVNVIFYIATQTLQNEKLLLLFIALCFTYALLDRYLLPCYFSSSNISLGLVYFYIGYKLKTINERKDVLNLWWFAIAGILFILISIFNPQWMQIVSLTQTEGLFSLNIVYALSGTYILWFIFSKLPSSRLFSYFGRNSITYYVWHMIPLRLIYDPFMKECFPQVSGVQYVALGGV